MQYDMSELIRLAQSPAGQQLIRLLQKSNHQQLQAAAASASSGDYSQAQNILSSLLSDPEIRSAVDKLGAQP